MKCFTAASALAVLAAIFQGAFAINQVEAFTCFGDTFFAKFQYFSIAQETAKSPQPAFFCWANAGDTKINYEGITAFHSGNNNGWFDYEPGDGYIYRHSFSKNQEGYGPQDQGYGTVVEIHID